LARAGYQEGDAKTKAAHDQAASSSLEILLRKSGSLHIEPVEAIDKAVLCMILEQTLNMGSNSSRWSTSFAVSPAFLGLAFFLTGEIYFDDGRVRVDTTFHAIHPAYFWGQSHGAVEKTNSHHYEQQGHHTGEARIGTERYKIDGVGVHDHAWGWGSRAGIRRWIWASAQFSRRLAVNTLLVTLADGREVFYGYIWRGKQNE
jgi:hypothetical protein